MPALGGTSLKLCEGRGVAEVGHACLSRRTGGWREDPADENQNKPLTLSGTSLGHCEVRDLAIIHAPQEHGSFGQRPYSLQPGVERPKNAQRFGRATPG